MAGEISTLLLDAAAAALPGCRNDDDDEKDNCRCTENSRLLALVRILGPPPPLLLLDGREDQAAVHIVRLDNDKPEDAVQGVPAARQEGRNRNALVATRGDDTFVVVIVRGSIIIIIMFSPCLVTAAAFGSTNEVPLPNIVGIMIVIKCTQVVTSKENLAKLDMPVAWVR